MKEPASRGLFYSGAFFVRNGRARDQRARNPVHRHFHGVVPHGQDFDRWERDFKSRFFEIYG